MQSLQAHTEEAESLLYHAKKCTPKYSNGISNGKQPNSIFQKLAEIRKEELSSSFSLADPVIEQNHIKLTDSRLIEKLVIRERLNTLIFNLYPVNRGFTLSVIIRNSDNSEETVNSMKLPYTEEQLFSYLDNEEIPPLLCSMIDNCVVHLYYNGCIIAEIRDYRKSVNLTHCVKHHVLLHQSLQTIVNDVNESVTANINADDKFNAKLELEKTLLLANYGPLCLTPRPSIAIANQKLHYSKYFLNTHKLRYKARKHTLLGIAQRRRQEQLTKCIPSISNLMEFIAKKKASQVPKVKVPKKLLPECPGSDDFWTEAARTVLELAKPLERCNDVIQPNFSAKVIEEYIIETRAEARLQFMIKLSISQRIADLQCLGEIQQSRELSTGGFHNISYSFPLGTHELATRYVLEFTNVYTERGKIRVNFTHKVPGKQPEVYITSGLRMEGNKLVPIESKSLGQETLVSWQTFSDSRNDTKGKNVVHVAKTRPAEKMILPQQPNVPNSVKQITVSSDSLTSNQIQLIRDQQQLQIQIQQQLQQQLLQQKRQQQSQQLQQEIKAITNFNAQIQEHLQMRQANIVNGLVTQPVPQYTSLLNKKESNATFPPSQQSGVSAPRTVTTVLPKSANAAQYQTTNNELVQESLNVSNTTSLPSMNGSNSTILSLLANTTTQPASSSAANVTLSNLLTSAANVRSLNSAHTVNVTGQRVVAKRVKMQNAAARVIGANSPIATSLSNATVIATSAASVNAQPVIRLSLSSLTNQGTPIIQQRGGKNIAGRILTPASLKTASLVNSIQPVNVTTAGSIQIGNSVHNITAVQSLLNNGGSGIGGGSGGAATTAVVGVANQANNAAAVAAAAAIRLKAAAASNNRRNVVVGGIQSLAAVNAAAVSNGQTIATVGDGHAINCAKIQTVVSASPQGGVGSVAGAAAGCVSAMSTGATHLSSGELQTLAGTLTAAPTIGTIQLTRNVQTLPAASVHLVTSNNSSAAPTLNAVNKTTTLSSIQLNAGTITSVAADGIVAKGQKIMRLSSGSESNSQPTSVELPMSALSALLSGTPITDSSIHGAAKGGLSLVERLGSATASTSQPASSSNATTLNIANASASNVGVQNVQVSIPGMAVPITLSLNVGDPNSNSYLDALSQNAHAVTSLSSVVGTSVILANSTAGGNIKTSTLRPVASAANVTNMPAGTVQQLQLIGSVQRSKLAAQMPKQVAARSLLNTNRVKVTVPPPNAVVQQQPGGPGQVLSVTAQQQLQLALQKQAVQLQLHQGLTAAGGLKVAQKRRRSSVATDGS